MPAMRSGHQTNKQRCQRIELSQQNNQTSQTCCRCQITLWQKGAHWIEFKTNLYSECTVARGTSCSMPRGSYKNKFTVLWLVSPASLCLTKRPTGKRWERLSCCSSSTCLCLLAKYLGNSGNIFQDLQNSRRSSLDASSFVAELWARPCQKHQHVVEQKDLGQQQEMRNHTNRKVNSEPHW